MTMMLGLYRRFDMGNTYPRSVNDIEKHLTNISTRIFGNRFMPDQTLYEYLIEFLLVFVSPKDDDKITGRMQFHANANGYLQYWIEPRMGLRRFVFYDKSKKNNTVKVDEKAYKELQEILNKKNINQEVIDGIQDLLHGYAVVIKKRSWCAQSLLPLCPEMVFCDAMPNEKYRKTLDWPTNSNYDEIDTKFDFNKRNFLARGGEVYYLHLLQALEKEVDKKNKLERLLMMLMKENSKLSSICNLIQSSWEASLELTKESLYERMSLSFIPEEAYLECGKFSVDELINFLSNELPSINKIEILAKGVMFQILRMLSWRVDNYLQINRKSWIVDMKGNSADTVKKIAAKNYRNIEEGFITALNKSAREISVLENDYMKKIAKARQSSIDLFRLKGKELQCIIPINGPFERFSLSEDIIKFLVLALIPPKEKVTLNTFLGRMYEHYGIVIGPKEYRKSINDIDPKESRKSTNYIEHSLTNAFVENLNAFQAFLTAAGFLKELSDATSIVINPYKNILEE